VTIVSSKADMIKKRFVIFVSFFSTLSSLLYNATKVRISEQKTKKNLYFFGFRTKYSTAEPATGTADTKNPPQGYVTCGGFCIE